MLCIAGLRRNCRFPIWCPSRTSARASSLCLVPRCIRRDTACTMLFMTPSALTVLLALGAFFADFELTALHSQCFLCLLHGASALFAWIGFQATHRLLRGGVSTSHCFVRQWCGCSWRFLMVPLHSFSLTALSLFLTIISSIDWV